MAIGARSLPSLRKLACVGVFVTILTNLRGAFELYCFLASGYFVTSATIHRAVRPEQWELGL